MKISLIICTYMRPLPLCTLLDSILEQEKRPDEIIIVDGSTNTLSQEALEEREYDLPLRYYYVEPKDRGLTRQRNFGIAQVEGSMDIVAFLDDDIVLTPSYFHEILKPYEKTPSVGGVGGFILNEGPQWRAYKDGDERNCKIFVIDGWTRRDGQRQVLRKRLGLDSNKAPGYMPEFGHGRSVGSLPPSGKIYPVQFFMGGVASYRREHLQAVQFSTYFEGYGLYEDMDFCLRFSRRAELVLNSAAQLYHYHAEGGRPNRFNYGKMVARNGWYVWRQGFASPKLKARVKWWFISTLLAVLVLRGLLVKDKRTMALTETVGRFWGMLTVLFNPPKVER